MATVNVRQLDDRVVQRLKRRAAANHRSLESEARHILAAAAEDDLAMKRKSFQELMARLRRGTKGHVQTPSEILIREDRESGHRVLLQGSVVEGGGLPTKGRLRSSVQLHQRASVRYVACLIHV